MIGERCPLLRCFERSSRCAQIHSQAQGHTDRKLTMGLAHNIARHMSTPAMPYNQVLGCGTRWKCPFIGPKCVFDKPWCKGVRGVTWRQVVFFQSVWTIGKPKVSTLQICMVVPGRLTPAWSGRTVIGRRLVKKMTNFFFQNRVARSPGGVTWRHRGVFPIRLDRCQA